MADWSTPPAVRLTADIARHPATAERLAALLGAPLPATGETSGAILGQGPNDWLVLCDEPAHLAARLESCGVVIATPAALAEFRLTADQLASGTAVRPLSGGCAVTRFAQCRVTVLAEADCFRMFVDVPVARHVAHWLNRTITVAP